MSCLERNEPQACTVDERDAMIALVDLVMREGIDQTFLTDYPLVYQDGNMENVFIIKDAGEIASVVPFIPRKVIAGDCHFTIGIISPTATSPNHLRKGYAGKCVSACIQKMMACNIPLTVLWTSTDNFRFYGHSKFQPVRSQDKLYLCKKTDAGIFKNHGYSVVEYDANSQKYLKDIQNMHEQEIFGILRADEDYTFLFNLPKSKTLIATQDDRPVGYLMVSHSVNKPGLVEAGGKKDAIETLVNTVLTELDDKTELKVYGNLTQTALGSLFEDKLPDRKFNATATATMMRINNVYDFMTKITHHLEQANAGTVRKFSVGITDTDEVVSFNFTQQGLELGNSCLEMHIEMSLQEFTSVIFGSHPEQMVEVPEILEGLFPFYFPIWQLDHS